MPKKSKRLKTKAKNASANADRQQGGAWVEVAHSLVDTLQRT